MAYSAASLDNTSHPVLAILNVTDGRTTLRVKFPKVRPAGADASDALWQARMQAEVLNAHNQAMAGTAANATPMLASLA